MADISKIVLPDGNEYDIKDATARQSSDGLNARLTGDIEIPANSDLDNYKTLGEYYCWGNGSSVSNKPPISINSFRLRVEVYGRHYYNGGTYYHNLLKQTLYPVYDLDTDEYYVRKEGVLPTTKPLFQWNDWIKYSNSDENYTTTEKTKLAGISEGAEVNVQSDWNETDTTADSYIQNKPAIPSATSDLTNDSNFVSDSSYVHTDNNFTTTEKDKLSGIATGAEVNVQSDWNETDISSDAYIKNKPDKLKKVSLFGDTRQTSANLTADGDTGLSHFLATSTMIEGKPSIGDGHIIHMNWDTTNGWDSQLFVKNGASPRMLVRSQDDGTWGNWRTVYTEDDPPKDYSLLTGTKIPQNANLNTYTTPGTYYCGGNADAQTMTNLPRDGKSFKLFVEYSINSSTYLRQTCITYDDGNMWVRATTNGGSSWSSWLSLGANTTYTPASANPLMDGTVAVGTSAKYAREDHRHPVDTSRAPKSHASSETTYGQGNASNYGHVKLSDTYTSYVSGGNAAGGVAASHNALHNAYANLRGMKTLWSGVYYMSGSQTITLSEAVSDQHHGIILVWSEYNNNAAQNSLFHSFFVPKALVSAMNGAGHTMIMGGTYADIVGMKYVYITDTQIKPHASNNATGTGTNSGVKYSNNRFVLRYVFGF